jgi:hypothetical protein
MNRTRAFVAVAAAASTLAGGAIGAFIGANSVVIASAASPTATPSSNAPSSNGGSGTFKPNEDATHEASESAQREAQEDAGQRPTVP